MRFKYINKYLITLLTSSLLTMTVFAQTGASTSDKAITKPIGAYSSVVGEGAAMAHPQALGGLIRVKWNELESVKGEFDWDLVYRQIERMDLYSENKFWSLAIIAGKESPEWLYDEVPSFEIPSQQGNLRIPKFWNQDVQMHLADLAGALAIEFGDDPRLMLVYLPQMTSNGVEGHFNGVPYDTLEAAGLTPERWIDAVIEAATSFAVALPDKAIAVEVHTILGESDIPEAIINELWEDPQLNQRVGAAMWWISGKEDYQADLVDVLREFPGDIYGQVIGRSDQLDRFEGEDYASVFEQAKELGMRYIEPWEYEFRNNTHDELLEDFNLWALSNFDPEENCTRRQQRHLKKHMPNRFFKKWRHRKNCLL